MADYSNSRAPRYIPRGNPQPQPRPQPRQETRDAANDPLSELARLIGQTDPFADVQRPPRSERAASRNDGWPAPPPAAPTYSTGLPPLMPEYRHEPAQPPQPHRGDYPAQPHPTAPGYDPQPYAPPYEPHAYPQQGYQPPPAQPQYRQPQYQEPYAGHDPQYGAAPLPPSYGRGQADAAYYGETGYDPQGYGEQGAFPAADPYANPYGYRERRPSRRNGLMVAVALVSFAIVGTAGAYAYRTIFHGGPSGPPPLIKADTGPSKIVPAQASTDSSAGKQIYDRVGSTGGQDERVVSREEQPVDVRPADLASAGGSGPQTIAGVLASQQPGGFPAASASPAPSQGEPHKVRTVTIRPEQQGSAPAASAPAARSSPSTQGATSRAAQQVASAPAGNVPLSLTPGATSATQSTGSARAPAGGYMVQISAQKSEAEATAAFNAAKVKYSDLLGTYQVVLRKKQIPGKGTFYGAQVGPFATREDATGLCAHLKSAGGNCLVEKN